MGCWSRLACEEIVMHPEAEIGEAGIDEDANRGIDPQIVIAYQRIASSRRTVPEAIAFAMVDPPAGGAQGRDRSGHGVCSSAGSRSP
jgi:hypothetical protein